MAPSLHLAGALEPRDGWTADGCTLAAALGVLSNRSTFLLLREAMYGATRFDEFVSRTGLSEPVAAARLRELVAHGVLERTEYREPGQRARQGYGLTEMGVDLLPAFVALLGWGDRWLTERGGPVEVRHHGCRQPVAAVVRCAAGHEVGIDELDLVARPKRR